VGWSAARRGVVPRQALKVGLAPGPSGPNNVPGACGLFLPFPTAEDLSGAVCTRSVDDTDAN
jgi:hypothetical protein